MRGTKHLRKLPPKTPPTKAKQGGVFVSATVPCNQKKEIKAILKRNPCEKQCKKTCTECFNYAKRLYDYRIEDERRNQQKEVKTHNPNPSKIKPFFLTLTADYGQNEDNLMKAFRKFLKEAATENQLRYIWKKEKGIGGKMHFHIIGDCSDNTDQLIELWVKICLNKGINTGYCYQSCLGIALSNEAISFTAQYFAKQSQQPIANRVVSMSNRFQHFKPIIGELARKMLKKDKIENQITFKANEETGEILYEVYKSDSIAEYYSTFL